MPCRVETESANSRGELYVILGVKIRLCVCANVCALMHIVSRTDTHVVHRREQSRTRTRTRMITRVHVRDHSDARTCSREKFSLKVKYH